MAGRFWKWRMQGGAIELAAQAARLLQAHPPPDAIIATDMVNLPAWLGLVRHQLPPTVPVLYYMHENQLTYPTRPGNKPDLTYAMINWLSQLAADHVAFNSRYHADNWFAELPDLLRHFPDYHHLTELDQVQAKSSVLPVGIDGRRIQEWLTTARLMQAQPSLPPIVLWNQRWEYDKNPKAFFNCLYQLQEQGVAFRLAVAGEHFRKMPEEFTQAHKRLHNELIHWGYATAYTDYLALLHQADLVISTAIHEFFGISILEAIAAGTFPLLPNRLSYPDLIPTELHAACLYHDDEELMVLSAQYLRLPHPAPAALRHHVLTHYDWPVVAAQYDATIDRLVAEHPAK
jgi:glycosyltransferase involved in cell wall biosynthesis